MQESSMARPPGYYRDGPRPTGVLRYWDGNGWGQPYWTLWRRVVTGLVVAAMAVPIAVGTVLTMSEPTGTSAAARRSDGAANDRGVAMVIFPGVAGSLILIGIHRRILLQDR